MDSPPNNALTALNDTALVPQAAPQRLGLIAGEGQLPVQVAMNAMKQGYTVVPYCLAKDNEGALKKLCGGTVYRMTPGLLDQNLALLRAENITQVVFAGKVNKWLLLRNPKLDARAFGLLAKATRMNDDNLMLVLINEMATEGLQVVSQTQFLQHLFMDEQALTQQQPTEQEWYSIYYGLSMAKEMGRLDIGQSIVVKDKMVLAVEAIEGTDACIERGGKLAKKKGGILVKVAKPAQDDRFDVPTVGLKTLKTMKRHGLNILATEANETLFIEKDLMITFANQHSMVIVSVTPKATNTTLAGQLAMVNDPFADNILPHQRPMALIGASAQTTMVSV